MKEINKFLSFINDNLEDDRVSIHKEMKNGCRCYCIGILVKSEHEETTNTSRYNSYKQLSIILDNYNNCLVMNNSDEERSITIENRELLEKWSKILEEYLNQNIDKYIKDMIYNVMSNFDDKDLYRDYQMKKILNEDED